jgi:uncharacterized membrane protein
MKKESWEILVGVFVAVVLLCAGYMAVRMANENVDKMIEKERWTQEIIAVH